MPTIRGGVVLPVLIAYQDQDQADELMEGDEEEVEDEWQESFGTRTDFLEETKVITSISALLQLLSVCQVLECGSKTTTKTFHCGTVVKISWQCERKHSRIIFSSPILGDKGKTVGIMDYFIGSMCEMSGLAITGVHRLFDQLKILICSKSYHYKAIVGITHGIV